MKPSKLKRKEKENFELTSQIKNLVIDIDKTILSNINYGFFDIYYLVPWNINNVEKIINILRKRYNQLGIKLTRDETRCVCHNGTYQCFIYLKIQLKAHKYLNKYKKHV